MRKHAFWLLVIFLINVFFRIGLVAFSPGTLTADSYYHIRQADHIIETGKPIIQDSMSSGGKIIVEPPLYNYALALGTLFFPNPYGPFLISILAISSLVFIVYALVHDMTKNRGVALFTAGMVGFVPTLIEGTLFRLTSYTLALPLIFLSFYFLKRVEKDDKYVIFYLASFLLLTFAHGSVFLVVLSTLVYFVFLTIDKLKVKRAKVELLLFSALLVVWVYFVMFKKPLLIYGLGVVWQNVPFQMLDRHFQDFNLFTALFQVGVFPFIGAFISLYRYAFVKKNKYIYLFTSGLLVTLATLWLKFVPLKYGLMVLGVFLVVLSGQFIKDTIVFVKRSRRPNVLPLIITGLALIFIVTSVVPGVLVSKELQKTTITPEQIEGYRFISGLGRNKTVLVPVDEEPLVTYFSNQFTVLGPPYLFVSQSSKRFDEIERMYSTSSETEAVKLMNTYGIEYVVLTKTIQEKNQSAVKEGQCFDTVYNGSLKVFKVKCEIRKVT